MSSNLSNRKAVPQLSSPSSDSMFYNYSPSMSFSTHQPTIRSPLAEDTDVRSPDFVWEAEYQDKMTVLKKSISQVPSTEKRQINFHFIDDMKATFDLKSLHSKRKRPTAKQVAADNKAASRKERKGGLKQLPEPSKKRRPRNAFILYRTVLQAKAEFKGKTQTELSRLIAACWQNEPPETRAHFERAAELEKAFGYGATDVFNVKVGPEKEWDAEGDSDQGMHAPINSDMEDPTFHQTDYGPPVNYPMYMAPFSPPFDHPQQDPYQIQASFQMLGSPYTDPPVYAGTPCGQINLSPQQAMFPFNTFPMESTPDQSAPMSPQEYDRSPSTFYATTMEQSTSNIPSSESFALQTSAPEVSDIPADYSAFDNYHVDYSQNSRQVDPHSETMAYSNTTSNDDTFATYGAGNTEMFSPTFHASHHSLESGSTTENGMYMQPQYPVNDQTHLDGYLDLGGQMFENSECFTGHNVPHYQ